MSSVFYLSVCTHVSISLWGTNFICLTQTSQCCLNEVNEILWFITVISVSVDASVFRESVLNPVFTFCRHKPSRPQKHPHFGLGDLGQRLMGARLRWRLWADILSLVRPCVSEPSMLCFLLPFLTFSPRVRVLIQDRFWGVVKSDPWLALWLWEVCYI